MKVCHETDSGICADAHAELSGLFDNERLSPVDASYADARGRWEPKFDLRPTRVPVADSGANIVEFSRYARSSVLPVGPQAPATIVLAPRTERQDLRARIEALLTEARSELGDERILGAILAAGLAATLDDRSQIAATREPAALNGTSVLTRREREVASLIAAGRTNRSIANELFIAQSTVERHVANILNKLGFRSRSQIAAWTVTNQLVGA